jgi:hypothetical protein
MIILKENEPLLVEFQVALNKETAITTEVQTTMAGGKLPSPELQKRWQDAQDAKWAAFYKLQASSV